MSAGGLPTVLVVDDKPASQGSLRACLSSSWRVLEAADGSQALALLEREAVDLVLFVTKPLDQGELELRISPLLRQVDDLTRLHQLKDELLTLLVHDMRNPLFGAAGYLHMLSKTPDLADQSRGWLQAALVALSRLDESLDDVLMLRTLEAGRLALELEPAPLGSVVRDALGTLEGAIREKSLSVSVVDGAEPVVAIDRKLVRRSLENILRNAIDYSAPCGRIEVAVLALDGGAAVEVADRGPGVPESMKTEIFEKFTTVDASRRQRRGYGLGLHLVKVVATAHGGAVTVRDREGGGSVFRMEFPRTRLPS
jgi:signal transduction histidine kinase